MYPICNIDYQKVLEDYKNNPEKKDVRCVIFLLYEKECKFNYYLHLSDMFEEINNNSNKKIAFITHFVNPYANDQENDISPDYLKGYRDWGKNQRPGTTANAIENEDKLAYKTMRKVAKSFDCGMENRLPCFVIFDPKDPQFFVEKSAKDIENIFEATQHIITDLQNVKYDIKEYATKYKEPHYYLSSTERLSDNLKASIKGINTKNLLEVLDSNGVSMDSSAVAEINRLREGDYIPVKKFFRNIDKIRTEEVPEGIFSKLIDEYLPFYSCEDEPLFDVGENIESSSKDYLRAASSFCKDENNINSSMLAICLGKIVEDEQKLGVFNAFRGIFNITLPEFHDRYQNDENLSNIKVKLHYEKSGATREIWLNKRDNDDQDTSKLKYPNVSDITAISFDKNCKAISDDRQASFEKARNVIQTVKNLMTKKKWDNILSSLTILADTRNDALHQTTPIGIDKAKKARAAFKDLKDVDFFKVNNELKHVEKYLK